MKGSTTLNSLIAGHYIPYTYEQIWYAANKFHAINYAATCTSHVTPGDVR